ncbi:DUF3152 domain-containing protein [Plantactinospora endophytica]|uniref:DUF3152 domain-containing protein n=1 Tax=Plantactinospora endophytica TaxID=673535 RepID=A0ABQ4E4X0_9ACTN|nr:DUF3152 domain-containing protein [Plantactinospora endophytica]GIG89757.1 hypothetical protein Pen02_46930 [Plantactinospora endophytica]
MTNPANPPDHGRFPTRPGGRLERARIAAAQARRRRRRTVALALLSVAAGLLTVGLVHTRPGGAGPGVAAAGRGGVVAGAASTGAGRSGPTTDPGARYPTTGPGTFGYAAAGRMLGAAGTVRRYHVAVEQGMGQETPTFAAEVDAVLGDPRGWTASRKLRLQRVGKATTAQFTVFLATPGTSEKMCATAGLHTERYGSCRLPGQVVLNVARWLSGVPDYGASLEVYQAFALNHELGHELGEEHQGCPRPGAPAPVMLQQTYGLRGCAPNGWPYVDGQRYVGPPIP